MIADRRRRIQDLVVRMQQAFLDAPSLRLTLPQARRQFSHSAAMCEAVLNFLVEAGVLSRTSRGQYVRLLFAHDRTRSRLRRSRSKRSPQPCEPQLMRTLATDWRTRFHRATTRPSTSENRARMDQPGRAPSPRLRQHRPTSTHPTLGRSCGAKKSRVSSPDHAMAVRARSFFGVSGRHRPLSLSHMMTS